jgi:GDP-L-fucose synthase
VSILVLGGTGLVGSAVSRELTRKSVKHLAVGSKTVDLTDRKATFEFLRDQKPEIVIDAAALTGGIHANNSKPVDFLSKNLQIQTNLFDASHAINVQRLLFLGSSCIYPRDCQQPIREEFLMSGKLEGTNSAYAIAKIAGVEAIRSYRKQFSRKWISVMPTNLYGPHDNFDSKTSHVIPGMINKFNQAINRNQNTVELWGTGSPRREFMHVDDLARAILFLLDNYDEDMHLNVGTGEDVPISELARIIASIMGFKGSIVWNSEYPDGTPRKLLDVSRISELGWKPKISLEDGLREVIAWYLNNHDSVHQSKES